jgi:hypothetical protein
MYKGAKSSGNIPADERAESKAFSIVGEGFYLYMKEGG